MKRRVLIQLLLLFSFSAAVAQCHPDACVGKWLTGNGSGTVEIFRQGNKYHGKIVWLKDPNDPLTGKPKTDKRNFNDDQQDRPLLGMINLRDLQYTGDSTWENGKIYDPETGKEYSCIIKLKDGKTLIVKGYSGMSVVGRTDIWSKQK